MEIREYRTFRLDEVLALYAGAGWTNYTDRADILARAYERSLCVLGAYDDDRLVGILRAVGDGLTILFIQDIVVLQEYRRQGIGTALLRTDKTEKTIAFYRSAGFYPAGELGCAAFVRM